MNKISDPGQLEGVIEGLGRVKGWQALLAQLAGGRAGGRVKADEGRAGFPRKSRAPYAVPLILPSQMVGLGLIGSLAEGREVVRRSFEVTTFEPRQPERWEEAYQRFVRLLQ